MGLESLGGSEKRRNRADMKNHHENGRIPIYTAILITFSNFVSHE